VPAGSTGSFIWVSGRAFLRRQYNINISENRADPETFHHEVNTAFHDFKRIINVPEDSPDYVDTMHHYETWVKDNIDPTMIIHESRPYAAGSSKYYIFDDGVREDPCSNLTSIPMVTTSHETLQEGTQARDSFSTPTIHKITITGL
jgi:hypothetical protein